MKWIILTMVFFFNLNANSFGELYFSGNCATCHFKTQEKSAPSIEEIRENYLRAFPKRDDFVMYMSTWVLKPNPTTSIMQHSIEKFELMPELAYDEFTLKEIAKYIYDTDFSKQH